MGKKQIVAACCLCFLIGLAADAQTLRVAVMDFDTVTENSQYRSLGKGFAELTSVQLARVPGIVLVDRTRRNLVMEEQAFSLSGGAHEAIEIGKLLAVDCLVLGSVVDMGGLFVVSYELLSTTTGEIIGKDQAEGSLADFKRIVREIGAGIAGFAGKTAASGRTAYVPTAPAEIPPEAARNQETVVRKYSEAVAALDSRDTATAKRRIEEARALDPTDPAIAALIAKLGLSNVRFQSEIDRYEPTYNPAVLGLIDRGSVFLWSSTAPNDPHSPFTEFNNGKYGASYRPFTVRLGLNFPVGPRAGFSAEAIMNMLLWDLGTQGSFSYDLLTQVPGGNHMHQALYDYGGQLGFGWRFGERLSAGAQYRLIHSGDQSPYRTESWEIDPYKLYPESLGFFHGASAGLAYAGEPVAGDFCVSWSNQRELYFEAPAAGYAGTLKLGAAPLVLNGGVSYALPGGAFILSARGKVQAFLDDRGGGIWRAAPGVEWRPFRMLGLRASYEATLVNIMGSSTFGSGGMGGLSATFGDLEVGANFIYRLEPVRLLPKETYNTFAAVVGIVWHGLGKRDQN